ncbi:glycosyl transferase [Thiohalorhabdus denitrificans]|uniref:Transferase 2, rSAM/selenodomain-associated n=1 Tax=Thiohalorhabdus denitrificans TaxID=381306 RepID=A0A0P9GI23_9GAMM|nr:TIGR04283 family arsenosugar biosynthesis glycosyltransferase [Thiohalorhabdus denitrificans]KPV39628.1 glycosyl transferase [Thiohalorhabdus denitrificans]SCX96253.1 transferase 2, rSAM/selenodomain-associated [Thiohalorhabdus denitrificans]
MAESGTPELSVVVPALNEAAGIAAALAPLQEWRERGAEVLVVDGGSDDGTLEAAAPWADRVLEGPQGRARQMNAGAAEATGRVLLFLHADTRPPEDGDRLLLAGLARNGRSWGRFDVRLSGAGRHPLLRVVGSLMNARSRLTGIATGDQGLFVERDAFEAEGGFPEQPLMEDIALSAALKACCGRPLCLRAPIRTSSRRWEDNGVLRTILLMWGLRLRYWLGADPAVLAARYKQG